MCCYTKRVALIAGILTARHIAFFQLLYQPAPIFRVLFENIVHSMQCYQLQKCVPHKAYKGTLLVLSRPPTDRATATTQTWEFNQLYAIHYGSELPFLICCARRIRTTLLRCCAALALPMLSHSRSTFIRLSANSLSISKTSGFLSCSLNYYIYYKNHAKLNKKNRNFIKKIGK